MAGRNKFDGQSMNEQICPLGLSSRGPYLKFQEIL
jgi:hypothetical protein